MKGRADTEMSGQHPDPGFTLVEVLLVILVLGLMAAVVIFSVGGIATEAETNSCNTDLRTLATAVEAFFAQTENRTISPADATADGPERTLIDAGFLRNTSRFYDLNTDGDVIAVDGSPCSVPA